jgi:hypothetical protein
VLSCLGQTCQSRVIAVRRLFVAAVVLLAGPAQAQIDPKVKAECMKAVDFQGCVKALSGDIKTQPKAATTIDINKINSTGNTCPSSFAYIGGGYCQAVVCSGAGSGHDYRLGGKGWSCKGNWLAKHLNFDDSSSPIRATYDPGCPDREPEVGKTSSCY